MPVVTQWAALISIVVTVVLFTITQLRADSNGRRAARAAAVGTVLDALDRVARRRTWPTVARIWHKPEVDYALLVPRLLVGLPKRDRPVAVWLATQVNLMTAAKTQTTVFRLAANASSQIANWYNDDVKTDWFRDEVNKHVPQKPRNGIRELATSVAATAWISVSGLIGGVLTGAGAGLAWTQIQKATREK